jgi:hypothetical protein
MVFYPEKGCGNDTFGRKNSHSDGENKNLCSELHKQIKNDLSERQIKAPIPHPHTNKWWAEKKIVTCRQYEKKRLITKRGLAWR